MSTTNDDTETPQREQLDERVDEKYTVPTGVEPSDAAVGDDEHPVAQALGDQDHYEFEYDPRATGRSIAERYDDPAAALREYIHNAETACIRAIRHELIEAGYSESDVLDMPLDDAIETAREETGYDPVIEVTHRHPGSGKPALTISDNGIGISIEEFLVMKKHARSTSFMDGSVGGQFGQGIYSIFMLIDYSGEGKFSTKSRVDDESYEMRMRLTGFNKMPGSRDAYGTTFTFPALSQEGQEVDIGSKIAEYCQGIRIPVMYEEYDESENLVFQDDFVPTKFEDDYDESDPFVVYETEYFKAVSSPSVSTGDRNPKTLLTSMPIERNDARYGTTDNDKFESPWKFDIRLKYEDGRVAFGPHAGLVPVEDATYESMDEDRKSHYIPQSKLTSDDVEMPKPVDDRDRLKDGYRGFFKRVSRGLSREFSEQYARVLSSVYSFDDVGTMDLLDRTLFVRGYSHFGPKTSRNDPDTIQSTLEDEVGVTVPKSVCSKLAHIRDKLDVVPRGTSRPHKKGGQHKRNREEEKAWKMIVETEPNANVYMGKTISEKKARMVWDLHEDNYVVQLDTDESYGTYEDLFGWKKLKDLPSQNLEEKLPELSDEFLDEWDTTSGGGGSSGGKRGSYDRDRAKERKIKVRQGTGIGDHRTYKGEDVYRRLDSGEAVQSQNVGGRVDTLIVVDQNEHNISDYNHLANNNIGQAVVPQYVKEYLLEADNIYEPEELRNQHYHETVTFDWSADDRASAHIGNLTEDDVVFVVDGDSTWWFKDNADEVQRVIDSWLDDHVASYTSGDITSLSILSPQDLYDVWTVFVRGGDSRFESNARALHTCSMPRRTRGTPFGKPETEVYLDVELPPRKYDRTAPEWKRMFVEERKYNSNNLVSLNETTRSMVQMIQELDECGDSHPFPSQRDES